ncbi:MAG TPA: hypothetical protein VF628_05455 [Allosphingosinicella sp.]|jgi:hypothetical protein
MKFANFGSAAIKGAVIAATMFASTAASATMVCQPGTGCVLPVTDAAPPPAPTEAAPPPVAAPYEAAPVAAASGGGGLGLFAILAGLAALGLLAFLVFDDDEEDEAVSP